MGETKIIYEVSEKDNEIIRTRKYAEIEGKRYIYETKDDVDKIKYFYPEDYDILLNDIKSGNVLYVDEYVDEKLTKKSKNKGLKKKLISAAAVITSIAMIGACHATNNREEEPTRQEEPETKDDKEKKYVFKNEVEKRIYLLKKGKQQETFKLLDTFLSEFNTTFANRLHRKNDKDNYAYISSEEATALFCVFNSNHYSAEEFYEIFKTNEYMEKAYTHFQEVMGNLLGYYTRIEEPTNISSLFIEKDDRDNYQNFENLIIAYNKADSNKQEEIKEKIRAVFNNIKVQTDDERRELLTSNSLILSVGVPWANLQGIINESELDELVELNETKGPSLCNTIRKTLETKAEEVREWKIANKNKKSVTAKIVKELLGNPEIFMRDETSLFDVTYIAKKDRQLNYASDAGILINENDKQTVINNGEFEQTNLNSSTNNSGNVNNNANQTPEQTNTNKQQISKEKVEEIFTKEEIKEVEEKAKEDCEKQITEKNKEQEVIRKALEDVAGSNVYMDAYSYIEKNNRQPEVSIYIERFKYNGDYSKSYNIAINEAIKETIKNAWNDYNANKKAQEEWQKNHKIEEIIKEETTWIKQEQPKETKTTTKTEKIEEKQPEESTEQVKTQETEIEKVKEWKEEISLDPVEITTQETEPTYIEKIISVEEEWIPATEETKEQVRTR